MYTHIFPCQYCKSSDFVVCLYQRLIMPQWLLNKCLCFDCSFTNSFLIFCLVKCWRWLLLNKHVKLFFEKFMIIECFRRSIYGKSGGKSIEYIKKSYRIRLVNYKWLIKTCNLCYTYTHYTHVNVYHNNFSLNFFCSIPYHVLNLFWYTVGMIILRP